MLELRENKSFCNQKALYGLSLYDLQKKAKPKRKYQLWVRPNLHDPPRFLGFIWFDKKGYELTPE